MFVLSILRHDFRLDGPRLYLLAGCIGAIAGVLSEIIQRPLRRDASWEDVFADCVGVMLGIALFALPVYALTGNPVLSYWTVWLLAFPLNALAMQALAYRITRDRVAAFGAGLVYAFCFLRMHHAHGHLQMLWTWPLPLVPQ